MSVDVKNLKLDAIFLEAGRIQAPAPPKDYAPPARDVLSGRELDQLHDCRLPRIKGESQTIASFLQTVPSGGLLIDEAIDTRFFNAVNVHVMITGSSPSVTLAVQGAGNGNYITLPDGNATRTLTADATFDVQVGTASVKVFISALSGTFATGQGVTIALTPFVAAGPLAAKGARTTSRVTVSTTPTLILAANPRRLSALVRTLDTTQIIYVGDANVATSGTHTGIPLCPGTSATALGESKTEVNTFDAIYGVVAGTTADVVVEEIA